MQSLKWAAVLSLTLTVQLLSNAGAVEAQTPSVSVAAVDFENMPPGILSEQESPLGTWSAEAGRPVIDLHHAKTGRHCLWLSGGERTSVTLELADEVEPVGELSFWAERWTRRKPFSFRIEKYSGNGWQEIFNGDDEVRVGRAFLSHVKIPLDDPGLKQLRFSCASPPNTGVLLDDIRMGPALPQRVTRVVAVPFTSPVLKGTNGSPLLKLSIVTQGSLNPVVLKGVDASLHWTGRESPVQSLFISSQSSGEVEESRSHLDVSTWENGQRSMLPGSVELREGENTVWVYGKMSDDASLDDQVGLAINRVHFTSHTVDLDMGPPTLQRLGIALRDHGDNDVHTFRIPGLVTTKAGLLIGVYDVRHRSGRDLPGDIDVGMSRSSDGGRTWEPMRIIMDMGDDPAWNHDGIGDPAILVDNSTGTIWVAAVWSHGNRGWHGSGPGLKPIETGQLMLVRSDDDGVTWSEPVNITAQVKSPEWSFLLQGPGKGITMRDGTLVFAAQYQASPDEGRIPYSTILFSKDHGETWHIGTGAHKETTEAQVIELEPGVLMLNCRYNREAARVVKTTSDMGVTWKDHPSSERALIEPGACMASLIDVNRELGIEQDGWILFSNPDSLQGRNHITIKASPDRGTTWPENHRLLLDGGSSAGYSCMSMIDKETIGILYEGSQAQLTFQRVPIRAITGVTRR